MILYVSLSQCEPIFPPYSMFVYYMHIQHPETSRMHCGASCSIIREKSGSITVPALVESRLRRHLSSELEDDIVRRLMHPDRHHSHAPSIVQSDPCGSVDVPVWIP